MIINAAELLLIAAGPFFLLTLESNRCSVGRISFHAGRDSGRLLKSTCPDATSDSHCIAYSPLLLS